MKNALQLYRRLLHYIRPYWRIVLISIVSMLVAASLQPVLPALLKPLIDESLIGKNQQTITWIPILIVLSALIKGFAEYCANVSSQWVSNKAIEDLRQQVFAHQIDLPLPNHQVQGNGRMLSRISYDIPQVGQALSSAWIIVIQDTLTIIGLCLYLIYTAWQLMLLILLMAPVVAWLIRQASGRMRGANHAMQESMAAMTSVVEESNQGLREIKIYATQNATHQRFAAIAEQLRKHTMRAVRVSALNVPLVQILAAIVVAVIIYIASHLSTDNRLSPGEFVAFVGAMAMLFEPIRRLTNINSTIQRGLAAAQSIFSLLDMPRENNEGSNTLQLSPTTQSVLSFDKVSFHYPGQIETALNNFNLDIPRGQTIAFVGASGSGKTTLIHLLARFYVPQQGKIFLDGIDINTLPLQVLRQQLAWVGQYSALFDDTIAANIAYGMPNASEEKILAAARAAHAMEFISQLPQGIHTRIGANGNKLSGGQRQRIALARAFFKDAPILLLDEATSALDNTSERYVRDALDTLRANRTVLVIAHRLSTIRDADLIVVMSQGKIVEVGTHETLLEANAAYAHLLHSSVN